MQFLHQLVKLPLMLEVLYVTNPGHSLLKLPVGPRGNKDLTGQSLTRLQEKLDGVECTIVDEYLLLGQTAFGWIDRWCKQATGFRDR